MIKKWTISLFSVFGAFFFGALAFSAVPDILGMWHLPAMGFGAAFMTVLISFISAPKFEYIYTTINLIIGAVIAWFLLEPSYYPESYGEDIAYQQTHTPIIATYTGALIAYLVCLAITKLANNRSS